MNFLQNGFCIYDQKKTIMYLFKLFFQSS